MLALYKKYSSMKQYGLRYSISIVTNFFLKKVGLLSQIQMMKIKLNDRVRNQFNDLVFKGPFEGLKLSKNVWWGQNDYISKIFGEYERNVVDELIKNANKYENFIDIGAADGFFALGILRATSIKHAYCFEISEKGRETIGRLSKINKYEDFITIFGEANSEELLKLMSSVKEALILCDIEGYEFELFDDNVLSTLRHCTIIIELHDIALPNIQKNRLELIQTAQKYFDVSFVNRRNPTFNTIDEISTWSDIERAIGFDECRPCRMEWVLLKPIHGDSI